MTVQLGVRIRTVGDDILVTNPRFIRRGISERTCNVALIELNQIGTVTETVEAIELCREAGWGLLVSRRSGATEDSRIADFAVAMGGDRSRQARCAAPSAWQSTTGCSRSRGRSVRGRGSVAEPASWAQAGCSESEHGG